MADVETLNELFKQLSVSKEQAAIKEASNALASFINGDFESGDAPAP